MSNYTLGHTLPDDITETDWKKWAGCPDHFFSPRVRAQLLNTITVNYCPEAKLTNHYSGTALPLGALSLGVDEDIENLAEFFSGVGLLSYGSNDHLLTIAPSRAGKGTTQIVPTLLTYEGSTLVIDIKGENHAITGRHRANFKEGAKVIRFAPFEEGSAHFNPLAFIQGEAGNPDANALAFDDCRFLAELMIPSQGAQESYWVTDARNLLSAILLHVKTSPEYEGGGNMENVFEIFANPEGLKTGLQHIVDTSDNLQVVQLISLFEGYESKVLSSVQSTATSELLCWASEPIQNATAKSDFDFMELKRSMLEADAPTTIYIVFPPDRVRSARNILRTIIGIAVYAMLRDNRRPSLPILYLLDEFPSLGYMPAILDGLAYMAGYGVQLWTFAQTIGQLRALYGEAWQNFPASAGMFSAFNINDVETSEYLSKMLGSTDEYQAPYTSIEQVFERETRDNLAKKLSTGQRNDGGGWYDVLDYNAADEYLKGYGYKNLEGDKYERVIDKEQIRYRFKTDQLGPANAIRQFGRHFSLVFMKGSKPAIVRKVPYYLVPEFRGQYDVW